MLFILYNNIIVKYSVIILYYIIFNYNINIIVKYSVIINYYNNILYSIDLGFSFQKYGTFITKLSIYYTN